MEVGRLSATPPFLQGAGDAILDVVANPWTLATFTLVTTLGPMAMSQNRFPRLKGATCWVLRDGMQKMYYVGLGVNGAKAVYAATQDDEYSAGHAVTLGGMLIATKVVGDRYMGNFLEWMGQKMVGAAAQFPKAARQWLHDHGAAMRDAAQDRLATSGLALCAHSFDEIATMVVSIKSLTGWMGRVVDSGVESDALAVPLPNEDWDGLLPEPPLAVTVAGYATLGAVVAAGAAAVYAGPAIAASIELPVLGEMAPALAAAF